MFSDDLFVSRGRLKMGLRQFTPFWGITQKLRSVPTNQSFTFLMALTVLEIESILSGLGIFRCC